MADAEVGVWRHRAAAPEGRDGADHDSLSSIRRGLVTRAIWGHATEQMQQHYSTVAQTEMREGIAKIISLAGVREAMGAKWYVLAL